MSITERLANLSIPAVIAIIAVLLVIRFVLLRQKTPFARSVAEVAESLAVAMGLVFLIIRPFLIQAFFIPSESMVPTLLKQDHIMVNKFVYRFWEPGRGDVVVFKSPPEAGKNEADFIKRVIAVPGDTVRITPGYVMVDNDEYGHRSLRNKLGGKESKVKLVGSKVYVDGMPVKHEEIAAAYDNPNGEVTVVPGRVYVNGKPVKESYTAEDCDTKWPDDSTPRRWISESSEGPRVVKIPKGYLLVMGDNRNDSADSRVWGLLERSRVKGKAMFIFWPVNRIRWIR